MSPHYDYIYFGRIELDSNENGAASPRFDNPHPALPGSKAKLQLEIFPAARARKLELKVALNGSVLLETPIRGVEKFEAWFRETLLQPGSNNLLKLSLTGSGRLAIDPVWIFLGA